MGSVKMTSSLIVAFISSQIFHDVAYKAKDRNDLLSGIDEFLDQVTVLPPGEWDPTIRIEPPKSVPSQVTCHTSAFTLRQMLKVVWPGVFKALITRKLLV